MKNLFYNLILFISVNLTLILEASKIYDCFSFFNELEVLEIRLNELYDYVDKFVLVEAKENYRGMPKPLFYQENKQRFEKFSDKIIHVIINEPMSTDTSKLSNGEFGPNWARENYQREQIMRGLNNCSADDLIMISDLDEIIKPAAIKKMKEILNEKQNDFRVVLCHQKLYRYFLNRFDIPNWPGSVGILYKNLQKCLPQYCRNVREKTPFIIEDGGWHFSYMGGYNRIIYKLQSFAHAECDTLANKDIDNIKKKIAQLKLVDIDSSYPKYILENIEKFKKLGFIDNSNC